MPASHKTEMRWLFGSIGFILVGVAFLVLVQPRLSDPSDAFYAGQASVRKHLKSPSSAKFSSLSDPESGFHKKTNGVWKAWGYVDSQNTFGAMLRSDWRAALLHLKGGWQPVYLRIGEKVIFGDLETFNGD